MTTTPLYDLLALCPACECVIMIDLRAGTVLQHAALLETPQEQLEGHLRRATDLFQAAQARSADALVLMTGRKIIPFPRAGLKRVSRRLAG